MPKKAMTEKELLGHLKQMESEAVGFFSDEVATKQDRGLEIYRGDPYGDEKEGRSSVVDRSAAEVVDWMMPDIMRVFAGGGDAVRFEPRTEDDVEDAKQATDYINLTFWNDNPGFQTLFSVAKDGFIQNVGYFKVWWEEKDDKIQQVYEDQSILQIAMLEEDDSVEIISRESEDVKSALKDSELSQVAFPDNQKHTVTIVRTAPRGMLRYAAIPPAEIIFAPKSRSLDTSPYVAHRTSKTIAEVVAEGLMTTAEAEKLAPTGGEGQDRVDKIFDDEPKLDRPKTLWVLEEYARVDMNNDGHHELLRVVRIGDKIIERDWVDENPFVAFTPNPTPHKIIGTGMVEDVADIQRINTVLTREMLDNLYLTNNPRKVVNINLANDNTIDDLLTTRVGAIVRVDGPPSEAIADQAVPFSAGQSFAMLEHMESRKEKRTGVTRLTQGVPDQALNDTASVPLKMMAMAAARKELIVRLFGNAVGEVFDKALRLTKRFQEFERIVRLNDRFVSVDPRTWTSDFDMKVRVGLGTGDDEQLTQSLFAVLDRQVQAIETGSGLSSVSKVFNTLSDLVIRLGLDTPSRYFTDPATVEQQEEEPSEEDTEAQTKIRVAEIQAQTDVQIALIKAKSATDKLAQERGLRVAEMDLEAELTAFKAVIGDTSRDAFSDTNIRRK